MDTYYCTPWPCQSQPEQRTDVPQWKSYHRADVCCSFHIGKGKCSELEGQASPTSTRANYSSFRLSVVRLHTGSSHLEHRTLVLEQLHWQLMCFIQGISFRGTARGPHGFPRRTPTQMLLNHHKSSGVWNENKTWQKHRNYPSLLSGQWQAQMCASLDCSTLWVIWRATDRAE